MLKFGQADVDPVFLLPWERGRLARLYPRWLLRSTLAAKRRARRPRSQGEAE